MPTNRALNESAPFCRFRIHVDQNSGLTFAAINFQLVKLLVADSNFFFSHFFPLSAAFVLQCSIVSSLSQSFACTGEAGVKKIGIMFLAIWLSACGGGPSREFLSSADEAMDAIARMDMNPDSDENSTTATMATDRVFRHAVTAWEKEIAECISDYKMAADTTRFCRILILDAQSPNPISNGTPAEMNERIIDFTNATVMCKDEAGRRIRGELRGVKSQCRELMYTTIPLKYGASPKKKAK